MTQSSELMTHCNSCQKITYHKTVHQYRNQDGKEDLKDENGQVFATVEGWHDWEMLECQGCKTVCLKLVEYFSEWASDPLDSPTKITYFPPHITSRRTRPSWFTTLMGPFQFQVPQFIKQSYTQIYDLLESENFLAAMLVCRALLETIAVENGAQNEKTFKQKLEVLKAKEFINSVQATTLNDAIFDAGSAAMHRGYNPSERAVHIVLGAIEKLLHTIYIEPSENAEIQKEKPPRKS